MLFRLVVAAVLFAPKNPGKPLAALDVVVIKKPLIIKHIGGVHGG